ncbi:Penicillin-binding protein activator LpoA precursor [Pseudoalteromonas sp. P1-9]|uniref:penicillin-binding protein activator n=1 Tax=Pseudoalteromonas sp. P1-9 TaxID=1710354 RepID=UPI0007076D50|nr:penicillin-binding protein activator [Pseudoalteromonas sp. P1-9]KPV97954.1 Penicillin-binding protein activator LpoA precursor [Pseudoalteromonas sp. P1-9]
MRLKLLGLTAIFSLLSACSTTEKTPVVETVKTKPAVEVKFSAQDLYQKALSKRDFDKIQLLYTARDRAIEEQNWQLVITICEQLIESGGPDSVRNQLYIALAYTQKKDYHTALETLESLNAKLTSPMHFFLHQEIYGNIYSAQALAHQAAPYLIRASETANKHNFKADKVNKALWQVLNQLSIKQLEALNSGSSIQRGWVSLALYTQLYIGDATSLQAALNKWNYAYSNHPASFALPDNMQQIIDVQPINVNRIAIILPSNQSKQKALSQSLKAGILAASEKHPDRELHFINSALSAEQIAEQLNELAPDFVIGPLLKENIDKLQQAGTLDAYPAMYLNTTPQALESIDHFAFALNPEHEVTQAVYHFVNKEFKKPLVIAPGNRLGKRLANHFTNQWLEFSDNEPEVGFYANKRDMQKLVQELLEVDKSKQRIREISLMFRGKLHEETRSRRDIDAIYIIADAAQTRLLKPSFDVNISTFAKRIPIFASSRSHDIKSDKTDKKDLAGLYFSEIPWMLPLTGEQQSLRSEFDQIWPEHTTLEQQLFAMGFDAVKLIPQLRQLQMVPGKTLTGLTGDLTVNQDGDIERALKWAQYREKQIVTLDIKSHKPTPLFIKNHQQETQEAAL